MSLHHGNPLKIIKQSVILIIFGLLTLNTSCTNKPTISLPTSTYLLPQNTATFIVTQTPTDALVTPTFTKIAAQPTSTPFHKPEESITDRNANRVQMLLSVDKGIGNQTSHGENYYIVSQVNFSHEGQLIAVAGTTGIYLYRADGLQEIQFIKTEDEVNSVDFSPDDKVLASGETSHSTDKWNHMLRLWQVSNVDLLQTLEGHPEGGVDIVKFSPDGRILASGGSPALVRLWNVKDGGLIQSLPYPEGIGMIWSLDFSPDNRKLITGSSGGKLVEWNVEDGQFLRLIGPQKGGQAKGVLSPDGQTIAFLFDFKTLSLYGTLDGLLIRTLEGHTDNIGCAAFSPDGLLLASGSDDKTIRLWQVSNGHQLAILKGHENQVNSVAFSPDGKYLISGSADGTIRLWGVSPDSQ